PQFGIECRGRFVKQHELRLERQRPSDRDSLLLAPRAAVRILMCLIGQADPLQQGHRYGLRVGAAAFEHPLLSKADIAQDRQVRKQVERLEYHSDRTSELEHLSSG